MHREILPDGHAPDNAFLDIAVHALKRDRNGQGAPLEVEVWSYRRKPDIVQLTPLDRELITAVVDDGQGEAGIRQLGEFLNGLLQIRVDQARVADRQVLPIVDPNFQSDLEMLSEWPSA